ncbi:histidine utilization repressor [Streptomyces sp. TRM S81-3]|uniref:Histidine utilization repressor n=1 Tax=Streptomyces griseicoloratus TaxID=2752516 RepID=A0A926QT11_9ACTN|nr:histidine utilization repressor [Streptomyces griseicoloratus]MBD0422621.1 histidine utilization repressor [Streptomyces griseicoloratus]
MTRTVGGLVVDPAELGRLYEQHSAGSTPAYQRVKDLVTGQIAEGHWREDDALPSESQFVEALGLSRMTVNRALRELAGEGVIRRVMGVGSFVAPRKASSALLEVHDIADEVRHRGHRYEARVLSVCEERADEKTGAHLGLGEGRPVFHSRVVHYEDGVAIQLEDRYVNPAFAPGYLEQDFTRQTPFAFLSKVAPLGRGEHIVEAVPASPEECAILGIAPSEPCLLIHRRTWSRDALVSIARLLHPGSRYRLEGAFATH